MSNLFQRLKEAGEGLDQYTAQAKVNIYGGPKSHDIEYDQKINIPFNIDMEARSWGIGQMSLLATTTIQIPISFVQIGPQGEDGQRNEQTLTLDLSTAETEWIPGGYFGIQELDISLAPEGGIANAKLVCVYIKKD